jgi:hypothetical protein
MELYILGLVNSVSIQAILHYMKLYRAIQGLYGATWDIIRAIWDMIRLIVLKGAVDHSNA